MLRTNENIQDGERKGRSPQAPQGSDTHCRASGHSIDVNVG